MGLLDNGFKATITHQAGELCPKCTKKRRGGVLITKNGMYGTFISCNLFPRCTYSTNAAKNLENQATALLKAKRKPRRRGKITKADLYTAQEYKEHIKQFKLHIKDGSL